MRLTGCDSNGILTVAKPTVDGLGAHNFVINGPQAIADDGYGICTVSWPAEVAYAGATAPNAREIWGPANGSWYLNRGKHGFWVVGVTGSNSTCLVFPLPREVAVIRKTSDTADANGYYPGQISHWDSVAKTWDDTDTCRIKGL